MTESSSENLKQLIKKNIYAKAHIAKIIFPPGMGAIALHEAQSIIADLWFAKKFTGEFNLSKHDIQIRSIYLFAIVELLLRNHCFTDIRLVVFKDTSIGKKSFEKKCREVVWDYYLNKNMSVKIKVNSIASTAFHESGLKEIMTDVIKPYVKEVVSGENTEETTGIYVELYKNKLTISISLAGQLLYKRGYRELLTASAPLREDIAACCIEQALLFARSQDADFIPDTIVVPFSGTGTLAFEYIQTYFKFNPAWGLRAYALQTMPLFKKNNFIAVLNSAKEIDSGKKIHKLICIEKSNQANEAFKNNLNSFKQAAEKMNFALPDIELIQEDFFKILLDQFSGNIFLPLNPPYGIRLGKESNSVALYQRIAVSINEIARAARKNKCKVLGFILCPDQETWSGFIKSLHHAKTETYHFNQGGLDIRACQFII